jgi:hypothetical protein
MSQFLTRYERANVFSLGIESLPPTMESGEFAPL